MLQKNLLSTLILSSVERTHLLWRRTGLGVGCSVLQLEWVEAGASHSVTQASDVLSSFFDFAVLVRAVKVQSYFPGSPGAQNVNFQVLWIPLRLPAALQPLSGFSQCLNWNFEGGLWCWLFAQAASQKWFSLWSVSHPHPSRSSVSWRWVQSMLVGPA